MKNVDVSTISPLEAQERIAGGAVVVDVREYPDWLHCRIPGARSIPLGDLKLDPQRGALAPEILTLCRSGARATEAAQTLAAAGVARPLVIEGGIEEWKAAGLPTQKSKGGPISLERQVRIGAGALVLLGLLVSRLRALSFFVSCGLIFAGITDWCGLAKLLAKAPWNLPPADQKTRGCESSCRDEAKK